MISLFGPQHGRILQAHYGESGMFDVQMTIFFDFTTKNDDNIDFLLSFITSGPRVGEFPDEHGDTNGDLDLAKQALSYRTGRM